MKKKIFHVEGNAKVFDIIKDKSASMANYINSHNHSTFSLWYKDIKHSDLITSGKRTKINQDFSKNILYYLTPYEMREIEKNSSKPFETAHQSNIGLSQEFYEDLGVERLQRRKGPQTTQHDHITLNDYVDVFLVNDTVKYFNKKYTDLVVTKLGKKSLQINSSLLRLNDGEFTPIQITQAIHGLGTQADLSFQEYRKTFFMNDRLYFIIEHSIYKNTLFLLFEKNPVFYRISGEANASWTKQLTVQQKQVDAKAESSRVLQLDKKTRKQQSTWKKLLSREMMNYTTHEGEVFCAFTGIRGNYEDLHMLYIASHIKRFEHCNPQEAFDINNGLLLCANADALFDKHMITITPDKKFKFSFLLDKDYKLQQDLLLNQPIFSLILNDERMKYMEEHRAIFEEKEKKRMKGEYDDDDDFEDYNTNSFIAIPTTPPLVKAAEDHSDVYNINKVQHVDLSTKENSTPHIAPSYKELSKTAKVREMTNEMIFAMYNFDRKNNMLPDYQRQQLDRFVNNGKELTFNQKLGLWYKIELLENNGFTKPL